MKKGIIVLLIAVLAVSSVFAVEFSGRFQAGYKFTFADGTDPTVADVTVMDDYAARWQMKGTVKGETWSLALEINKDTFNEAKTSGTRVPLVSTLTVDMNKFVENIPEDIKVKLVIASQATVRATNLPYSDPCYSVYGPVYTTDSRVKFSGNGVVFGAKLGYKGVNLNVYGDFNEKKSVMAEVYGAYEFLSAGAAIDYEGISKTVQTAAAFTFDIADVAKIKDISADVSAYVYIKKVADADPSYRVFASIEGGYKSVSAYAEFILDSAVANKASQLTVGAEYDFSNGVDVSGDVVLDIANDNAITLEAGVSYTTADGIGLYANASYDIAGKTFAVSPYVQIDF